MGVIDDWRSLADSLADATERLATASSGLATPGIANDDDAVSPGSQFSSRSTVGAEAAVGVEGTDATRAVEGAEAGVVEDVAIIDPSGPC